jgi:hypothetical protein
MVTMRFTVLAAFIMGCASCWWRIATPTHRGEKDRTFYIFSASFTAYINLVELIKALL